MFPKVYPVPKNVEHLAGRRRMAESAGAMGRHDAALVIAELLLEMVNPA